MSDGAVMLRRLEKALAMEGTHSVADVVARVEAGQAQWWGGEDGIAITEIYDMPRKRWANIWITAGMLDACCRLEPEIEAWARTQGCSEIRTMGRLGWRDVGPRLGFHQHAVQWLKPLKEN